MKEILYCSQLKIKGDMFEKKNETVRCKKYSIKEMALLIITASNIAGGFLVKSDVQSCIKLFGKEESLE